MKEIERIIRKIDPEIEYQKSFYPSAVCVCEVKKNNSRFILKMTFSDDEWGIAHLNKEKKMLILAEEISGITHLVQSYKDLRDYKGIILKEFYEGKNLEEQYKNIEDISIQKKLENTVRSLHKLGIADLNLEKKNIILSQDEKDACIVDLGTGMLLEEVGYSAFKKLESEDLKDLEKFIFGNYDNSRI